MRKILSILPLCLLCGCAAIVNRPTNAPATGGSVPVIQGAADTGGEYTIALSFSGGGLRAAAFSYGVLEALRSLPTGEGDALGEVAFITSVSGGSLTAAYYGAFGREGLPRFRKEVLLGDFERDLLLPFDPLGVVRVLMGGATAGADFRDRLDREVFQGATFASILDRRRPDIRINATDLYNRVAFPFIPRAFGLICSDLRSYRVADAVAASMAVPLVFAPVVLRTYPDACTEPLLGSVMTLGTDLGTSRALRAAGAALRRYRHGRSHYLRLADGGLSDNHGLSTLQVSRALIGTPYAPFTARDAVRARRLLFIVVDAAQAPGGHWHQEEEDPSAVDIALLASATAVDASARHSADAFAKVLAELQTSIAAWRCSLSPHQVAELGAPAGWECAEVSFSLAFLSIDDLAEPWRARIAAVPTRLSMEAADAEMTVEAARVGLLKLPQLREYLAGRESGRGSVEEMFAILDDGSPPTVPRMAD